MSSLRWIALVLSPILSQWNSHSNSKLWSFKLNYCTSQDFYSDVVSLSSWSTSKLSPGRRSEPRKPGVQRISKKCTWGDLGGSISSDITSDKCFMGSTVGACWHAHLQIYRWWFQVSRDSQKLCSFHSQTSLLPRARHCLKPGMKTLTSGRFTAPCQRKNVHDSPSGCNKEVLLKDYGKTTEAKRQCFGWSLTVPGGSGNLDGFRRLYLQNWLILMYCLTLHINCSAVCIVSIGIYLYMYTLYVIVKEYPSRTLSNSLCDLWAFVLTVFAKAKDLHSVPWQFCQARCYCL